MTAAAILAVDAALADNRLISDETRSKLPPRVQNLSLTELAGRCLVNEFIRIPPYRGMLRRKNPA